MFWFPSFLALFSDFLTPCLSNGSVICHRHVLAEGKSHQQPSSRKSREGVFRLSALKFRCFSLCEKYFDIQDPVFFIFFSFLSSVIETQR